MQVNFLLLFISGVIILSSIGFILASRIRHKKKTQTKLICPMHANCDSVIHSDYSRIGPFPVEVLGMMYYFVTSAGYLFLTFMMLWSPLYRDIAFVFSAVAVAISAYLIFVQGFVLKEWCTWCIFSAMISTLIFLLAWAHLLYI